MNNEDGRFIECICCREIDARPCTQEMRVDGVFLSRPIQRRKILFSAYCCTRKILLTRSKSLFQVSIFMLEYCMKNVVYLVFLWCFFGFVHSIMISHFFKEILIKFTGKAFETYFYRIVYNLISLVIYLKIVYFVKSSTETFLLPRPLIYIFAIISLAGFLIAVIAFFQTNVLEFLGIRQVWMFFAKGEKESKELFGYDKLVADGMFRFVRHPMYFGVSLVFMFNPFISTLTLIDRICAVSYLIIGTFFEEKRMLRVFGVKYKLYKEDVPRFLPYKFTHSPGHKGINV